MWTDIRQYFVDVLGFCMEVWNYPLLQNGDQTLTLGAAFMFVVFAKIMMYIISWLTGGAD